MYGMVNKIILDVSQIKEQTKSEVIPVTKIGEKNIKSNDSYNGKKLLELKKKLSDIYQVKPENIDIRIIN
jgi:hypothetical protein